MHPTTARRPSLLLIGAAGVLVSGFVHFRLYFDGGYRGIAPESFAGITISRAFAVNALAGFLIAWALVVSVRVPRLAPLAALAGAAFAAGTLGAYALSRTVGILGFEESATTTDAVLGAIAEVVALVALGAWIVTGLRSPAPSPAAGSPSPSPQGAS